MDELGGGGGLGGMGREGDGSRISTEVRIASE
jgi:hypothetical protein